MSSPISIHCFTLSKPCVCSFSSLRSCSKPTKFHLSRWPLHLGFSPFSPWTGLKHLGISFSPPKTLNLGKNRMFKGRGVHASLFGVGAPEALVIGVVALLVFGPKGLAEVARNLGKTLRAFQPTIKELQEVSREFKSTLEREIGLDEVSGSMQNLHNSNSVNTVSTPPAPIANTDDPKTVVDPNGSPPEKAAYTSEEYLKITEEQLKAVSAAQQQLQPPQGKTSPEPQNQPQATVKETADTMPPQKPEI
ncbi:sec-independent protein translocase protein TATB, chloroplastic [Mangifera indica]|uniref:sec-independent protein translocase protein TATB, chloroplastic n=1 Tax=Mangifera indica TaxID=29780 RepID=UPI001CFA86AE|nr:sec-independent protein translocase protein TATB, chloroplastic [Mangifera indica]